MSKCIFCGEEITDINGSKEHILLESLGGKLAIQNIVCKSCNSKFGSNCDSDLYNELKPLAVLFDVKRKEKNGTIKSNYRRFILEPGGKINRVDFKHKEYFNESGKLVVNAVAYNNKQIEDYLKYLNSKYNKNITIDKLLANCKYVEENIDNEIAFPFNFSNKQFPSIVKSAIEFVYVVCNYNFSLVKNNIIKFNNNEISCCKYAYDFQVYINPNSIYHIISLQLSHETNQVFVYISYFGIYNFIVIFCDKYIRETKNISYIHDIINDRQIVSEKIIDLSSVDYYKISEDSKLCEECRNALANRFCFLAHHKDDIRKITPIYDDMIEKLNNAKSKSERDKIYSNFFVD